MQESVKTGSSNYCYTVFFNMTTTIGS